MTAVIEPKAIKEGLPPYIPQNDEALAKFDKVVSSLYGCIQREDGFSSFLDCYRAEFQIANAGLICVQELPFRSLVGWASGYPRGLLTALIKTRMLEKDDAIVKAMGNPLDLPVSFSGGDSNYDFFENMSVVAKAWTKPLGLCDSVSSCFSLKDNERYILVANREKRFGVFKDADLSVLERLQPHIKQAVILHEAFHQQKDERDGLSTAFEFIQQPVALYSSQARLLSANSLFAQIGKQHQLYTIDDRSQTLNFSNADVNSQFQAALSLFLNDSAGEILEVEYLFIEKQGAPLRFTFRSMLSKLGEISGVFVEAKDLNNQAKVSLEQIRSVLTCTDSESRVLRCLLEGKDNQIIADELCLSVNTVRSYLKSVMAKNAIHRQIDLLSVMMKSLY